MKVLKRFWPAWLMAFLTLGLLLGGPPAASAEPEPVKMTAAQQAAIDRGEIVVSKVQLAAAGCEHEFHNNPSSDGYTRLSDWNGVWRTVHIGYYAYGHWRKVEVRSGLDLRLNDWSSSGSEINVVTIRPTGWTGYLTRWTGKCAVRTRGLHYSQ